MKLISFQFSCPIEDFSRYIHLVDNFASGYSEAVKTNCTECLKIEEWLKIIHYLTILLLTTGWVGSSLSMGHKIKKLSPGLVCFSIFLLLGI